MYLLTICTSANGGHVPKTQMCLQVNLNCSIHESIMYHFLWNSKVERVKRNIMIAPYEDGGLKMLDIRSQSQALKIKWIDRLKCQLDNNKHDIWTAWLVNKCDKVKLDYLLKCNLHYKDLSTAIVLPEKNPWFEILREWCIYNFDHLPLNGEDIRNQNLWFNSLIKINKKLVFHRSWYISGIETIQDLLVDNRFLTVDEIKQRYGINLNFLQLWSIHSAIPTSWKHHLYCTQDDYVYKINNTVFIIL